MTPLVINILTFLAAFFAVYAVSAVLADVRETERKLLKERLDEQLRKRQRDKIRAASRAKDFSQIAADALTDSEDSRTLMDRLRAMVAQSGLDISVQYVLTWSAVLGVTLLLAVWLLTGAATFGAIGAAVGASLPILYVSHKRRKRLAMLRKQLPDAFELMARVMRSGQTISQAMQAVADEFDEPISLEFLYCSEQMNLGLPQETSLRDLAHRTGLLEIKIFVLGVLVHRTTGGNLAELLDNLGHVVRERFRISGMIESLTAQGRLQATILLSLPPGMFLYLMIVQPSYERILLGYPMMVGYAVLSMVAGWYWIRRIVSFDY